MVISSKTLARCRAIITSEWQSTSEIMSSVKVGRGHCIKMLNALKRDGLIKKKQPQHDFNTCNKKEALWALKTTNKD